MNLRIKSETPTTIVLQWDPLRCDGYVFTSPDGKKSRTGDGTRTTVTFAKQAGVYHVEPLTITDSWSLTYPPPATPPPPPPAGKIQHGAWVTETGTAGAPTTMSQIAGRWPAGKKATIVHWGSAKTAYPGLWGNVKAYNPNAVALCDWDLGGVTMADVAAGKWDGYLTAWADTVKGTGVPTVIRFAHEFNVDFGYPWQKAAPADYVAAWKRMAGIMQPRGIRTMWCPNVFWPGSLAKDPQPWLPPANTVDLVGLDGYDWGMTFERVFKTAVDRVRVLLPGKPVWIAETNVSIKLMESAQQAWIEDAFRKAAQWKIDGMCLFIRQHDDGTWIWADRAAQAALRTTVGVMPEYA